MAEETLVPNADDSGWPTGAFSDINEDFGSPDAAIMRTTDAELSDVLIVPIQCVINQHGTKVCYVAADGGPERREVETGQFNKDFVEIKSGLSEGEKVLLNPLGVVETKAVVK